MIQWNGDNLKEVVDFTGKCENFDKWFKSFEEYEKYVHEHNDIFKIFNEDGSHIEVPVGAWIVKTPDGYNTASRYVFRQTPAWSEEDEAALGDALWCCKQAASLAKDENDMGNIWHAENWLESIKGRVQPQQEWSEEDESRMENLCHFLKEYGNQYYGALTLEGTINWLKSLRPQSYWKPSDEQMDALETAVSSLQSTALELLYNELKRL